MEVGVHVDVEDFRTGDVRHVSTAYLTFVAIDEIGHSVAVPQVHPETEDDKRRYEGAEARRASISVLICARVSGPRR